MIELIPSYTKIIDKKFSINDLRPIKINDLLGRAPSNPKKSLLIKSIRDKCILVTGSGGSIGSEICKQVIKLKPKKLILLDSNEFSLYNIQEYLKQKNKKIEIISILSSLEDLAQLENLFKTHKFNTIYHAAAYKHVNLVENNVIESLKNNILSTYNLLNITTKFKVQNFSFISTDKAVNPTSIMGLTKKFSELICQAYSQSDTRVSIVRFGNVLGSSGSVIPKFEQQIKKGGPVTVTDPNVSRYFMLISEAAQLVLQTTSLSTGKEIFVLDMGEPIKIIDLAILLIRLYGYKPVITNKQLTENSDHIRIEFTSLNKEEKLNEELFNEKEFYKTTHARILYEKIKNIPEKKIHMVVKNLKALNSKYDEKKALIFLKKSLKDIEKIY